MLGLCHKKMFRKEQSMKNKTLRITLLILAAIAAPYIFCFIAFLPVTTYQWHGNLSSEDRGSLAEQALMPQMADYVERYGTRGFQDVELKIETVKFSSLEEMAEKLNLGKSIDALNAAKGSDMKNQKDAVYDLNSIRPVDRRYSDVGADFSLIKTDSLKESWTWNYSIQTYKDGSCRFIVLILPL